VTTADQQLELEITQVFTLLGVLLVFVLAYLSALLPQIEELLARPTPEVHEDRDRLVARLAAYRRLVLVELLLTALVLGLLLPLTMRTITSLTLGGTFRTVRVALLVVDLLLLGLACATVLTWLRLRSRSRQIKQAASA
jgi:hypothetical protein